MRMTLVTLLGLLSLPVLPLSVRAENPARPTFEVETLKDIAYYDGTEAHPVKHKLDLFLPRGRKDFPVLIFVHGGSWRHGDKSFLGLYTGLGQFFAQQGVGTAVINYRLSPTVKHPEHVKDVARAFAWVHKNIPRHGGRADRIFVFGHSAGGHLVSLLATDESYLKAEGLSPRQIRGVVAMSGVYEIPQRMFAQAFDADPELRKRASPLHQVRAGLAPFLILYADMDFSVCGKTPSEAFAKALKEKGNEVKTLEIAESNHYHIILTPAWPIIPRPRPS